jgi:integrating conjugative element protein (TIGR03757 family)
MIGSTQLIHFVLTVLGALALNAGSVAHAAQNAVGRPSLIEVFDTADSRTNGEVTLQLQTDCQGIVLQRYELNWIQLVEAELSYDLKADSEQSKRLVLQRIQALGHQTRTRMQRSAVSLAKAMQYGIDRFPAIVFDGQAVVYGVTDLSVALAQYQVWQTGVKP